MKKVFIVVALAAMVLAGCVSYTIWYLQDGLVPFEHFQTVKNADERLVVLSPVLASNHRQSGLYIITNPEEILKAMDTLGTPGVLPPKDLDKVIRPFSPVLTMSSPEYSNGVAVFSLPPFIDQFFYVYMIIKQDYRWGSNDPAEVLTGIMSLPPGSQDVYMAFFEEKGDLMVSANVNPNAAKNAYDTTTGYYGQLLGKKDQAGFIKIGFKERVAISGEQSKAKALAAGATYSVYSRYYTYRQETRTSARYVPEQSHWEPGQTVGFYDNRGAYIGEARTAGRRVTDVAAHRENEDYTVNVPVLHELEFELYKGDVRVFRGRTPAEITGIEVGTEYTLRWVSPVGGNRSFQFKMGLNFLGYPGHGEYYIE
jgi:hypothetical protein